MPSIPQSLLWISLVVLWLFVLVPMLINKRDTVRRTSDVALATRVLNGGVRSRLIRRGGPATGHRHDPDWKGGEDSAEDYPDLIDEPLQVFDDFDAQRAVIEEYDEAVREARAGTRTRSVVMVAAVTEQTLAEPDYLDVDIVDENSGALPVGGAGVQTSLFDPPQEKTEPPGAAESGPDSAAEADPAPEAEPGQGPLAESDPVTEILPIEEAAGAAHRQDGTEQEYEYVDDTSGLEAEGEAEPPVHVRPASRRRRLESSAAAAVSARKYRFRTRMLLVMAALMVGTAVASFTVSPTLWWSCGAAAGVTVLYLAYLRRQTRIEEQVRRRRQQRMARSGRQAEGSAPWRSEVDLADFPTRLQRPGAVVLEIDDEDPIFEHLDEVPYSRRMDFPRDLPRAAGQ